MARTALLTLRIHRFEVFALGAAALVTIVAALVAAWQINAFGLPPGCMAEVMTSGPVGGCAQAWEAFSQLVERTRPLIAAIAVIPLAAGLFLGAPVVAREIERGTTRLAWSLAPSRLGWYASRILPILGIVILLSALIGVAADLYLAARSPDLDMNAAFYDYGVRGILVPARAALVFATAVVAGAAVGRLLPAILVAGLLAVGLFVGVQVAHDAILQREAIVQSQTDYSGKDRYVDTVIQFPDGTIRNIGDVPVEYHDDGTQSVDGVDVLQLGRVIPGERYPEVAAREALGVGILALALLLGAAAIISRRRPG